MRTLVGAAEPQPRRRFTAPRPGWYVFGAAETSSNQSSTTVVTFLIEDLAAAPREPYRTTAWVGRPMREIEGVEDASYD